MDGLELLVAVLEQTPEGPVVETDQTEGSHARGPG
jgi:hypothetical protein